MRAVVHDLLSLFAEQQSIPLPMAVLICPTCLQRYTHSANGKTQLHAKAHLQESRLTLLFYPSVSPSHAHTGTYACLHGYKLTPSHSCLHCHTLRHTNSEKKHMGTHTHTHTPPRLIVAVMGRVSSNGTHKCPGEKSSLWIDRMWE